MGSIGNTSINSTGTEVSRNGETDILKRRGTGIVTSVGEFNSVINAGQMTQLPVGSQVDVQNISAITHKPTGTTTTLTLTERYYAGNPNKVTVWVGPGYSDILNNSVDIFNVLGQREIRIRR